MSRDDEAPNYGGRSSDDSEAGLFYRWITRGGA